MKYFAKIFTPTGNRRLNELIGFLLCVSALLLFLALASYSPLDPSLNSASVLTDSRSARNWIGVVGALVSDLVLQTWGIGAFLLPVFLVLLGMRWFRSRKVGFTGRQDSWGRIPHRLRARAAGLAARAPALDAGHPDGGLIGRVVGDFLIHYFNLAGAYIVCASVLAVALYMATAFSFSAFQVWMPTRFAFAVALKERWKDWQESRAKERMQKDLEKRRANPKPVITTQLVPAKAAPKPAPEIKPAAGENWDRTGIRRGGCGTTSL